MLLQEMGMYSVSLYRYQLDKLYEMNAVYSIDDEILVLETGYYDEMLFVFDKRMNFVYRGRLICDIMIQSNLFVTEIMLYFLIQSQVGRKIHLSDSNISGNERILESVY